MTIAVRATTSQVPGGRTLSQMQRDVLSYVQAVQDDDELNALAKSALNLGIDLHNSRNWLKLQRYQDVLLTVGTSNYALASAVKDPRAVERLDSDGNPTARLLYKMLKSFLIEHPSATENGTPSVYTIMYTPHRELMLDLAPDTAFVSNYPTLRFHYYGLAHHLVGASDTTGWPSAHDAWLIWYARMEVASMRDQEKVAVATRNAGERWERLTMDDADGMTDWSDD